eukprot:510642-Lingulodinium_polyedra.AAC.1
MFPSPEGLVFLRSQACIGHFFTPTSHTLGALSLYAACRAGATQASDSNACVRASREPSGSTPRDRI